MCIVQLERLDKGDAAVAKRLLADIFWIDVDDRVRELGSTSSTVRARGKRELVEQFYGLSFAYTEGAAKNDCVLASALWRCVGMYSLCTGMYSCVTVWLIALTARDMEY